MQVNRKYMIGTMRAIAYLLWIGLFVLFIPEFMPMITEWDTDGAITKCITFQWLTHSGSHRIFALDNYFALYTLSFPIYLIYELIRRWIVGFNPSILWRLIELSALIFLYWRFLLTGTYWGVTQPCVYRAALSGVLMVLSPYIILHIGAKFLSSKKLRRILLGYIIIYMLLGLFTCAHMILT